MLVRIWQNINERNSYLHVKWPTLGRGESAGVADLILNQSDTLQQKIPSPPPPSVTEYCLQGDNEVQAKVRGWGGKITEKSQHQRGERFLGWENNKGLEFLTNQLSAHRSQIHPSPHMHRPCNNLSACLSIHTQILCAHTHWVLSIHTHTHKYTKNLVCNVYI